MKHAEEIARLEAAQSGLEVVDERITWGAPRNDADLERARNELFLAMAAVVLAFAVDEGA